MCTSSTTAPTPTVLMYLGDTAVVLEYGTKFSTLPMSMTLDVYPVLNLATAVHVGMHAL